MTGIDSGPERFVDQIKNAQTTILNLLKIHSDPSQANVEEYIPILDIIFNAKLGNSHGLIMITTIQCLESTLPLPIISHTTKIF